MVARKNVQGYRYGLDFNPHIYPIFTKKNRGNLHIISILTEPENSVSSLSRVFFCFLIIYCSLLLYSAKWCIKIVISYVQINLR